MPRHRPVLGRSADAGRFGRRVRAVPTAVWLITGLWGVLLLGASLLWPMTYGYDEPQHIDMAYAYSAHPFHFYGPGELLPAEATQNMQKLVPGYPPTQRLSVAPIAPRGQRPTFAQLGGHAPTHGTQPNQMVQHPPLYYWTEAVVLRLPGVSHLPWDVQVWLMRLLSVAFMLAVPLLCWATAHRLLARVHPLAHGESGAVLAAAIPLTIPNLIRDGSSVTNDSLLILATSVVLYLCCRAMTGDLSRRTSVWMGFWLAVALLTKGFALVLPPIVLVAYVLGLFSDRERTGSRLRLLWPALIAPVIGGVVGGLWWLRNLIDYGTVQTDGFGSAYQVVLYGPPDNRGTFGGFLPIFASDFIARIWGGIGLPDLPSPGPFVIYGWFALVLIGAAIFALARSGPGSRVRTWLLTATVALTVGVVAEGSYSTFHTWSSAVRGTQGRYLYHVIVVIAAFAALGWARIVKPGIRPILVPTVVAAAVLTNALSWVVLLRSWYGLNVNSLAGLKGTVHGLLRWSPVPSPLTVLVVGLLPVAASILSVTLLTRDARRLSAGITAALIVEAAEPTAEAAEASVP
jgi:hypothetical protein